jgi:hypothetical protein
MRAGQVRAALVPAALVPAALVPAALVRIPRIGFACMMFIPSNSTRQLITLRA